MVRHRLRGDGFTIYELPHVHSGVPIAAAQLFGAGGRDHSGAV
jgi:hypothetical protein